MCSFSVCAFPETRASWRENKNPPENPAGFRKTYLQLSRSEIPPGHNEMPRNALQRGGGNHRHGWFHEHFERILRNLNRRVNEFATPQSAGDFWLASAEIFPQNFSARA